MDKGKIIIYGIIAFVILLTVIYTVSVFSGKKEATQSVDFAIPEMVEKEQAKDDYNSRLKNANANAYNEPEQKKDIEETVNFKTYESDKKEKVVKKETVTPDESQTVQRKVVKVETRQEVKEVKTLEVITPTEEKKEVIKEDDSGFGIVMAQGSSTSRPTPTNTNNSGATINTTIQNNSSGFFAAVLEEDSQIKSGSQPVFYLIEDCTFDGVKFKKNSILYGQSILSGDVFDIRINQIMNSADSRVYAVFNVSVYNENYKKGLPTGGKLNESVKEGLNQTTTDEANNLGSAVGANTTVGIAAKTLNNTIRALSSKKETYINRKKGYKIYIKQD